MIPLPTEACPVVETDRLVLRGISLTDAEWIWRLDQDPDVMRFISGGVATPREVVDRIYLPRMLQGHPQGRQYGFRAAILRETGACVGWFHLRPERSEPFDLELGYRLQRDVWGRGLATEGSLGLLRLGFGPWGLDRVAARAVALNSASRRVMEKCGMQWESSFLCPAEWFPGWPAERRRGVRYVVEAREFRAHFRW